MVIGDGAANNSCEIKRSSKNKNIIVKRTLYARYTKPLQHVEIEKIAKLTRVDEFSKKLKLQKHLLTMVHSVIEDCKSLTELSGSLKGKDANNRNLEPISKGQLSTINKTRDYRVLCMALL